MGERTNVIVKAGQEQVCLYSHWDDFDEVLEMLREALRRGKSTWSDFQYLTRIIFCRMIRDNVDGLTGYGITQIVHDNGHPITTVNIDTQQIEVDGQEPVSFERFIE